MQSLKNRIYFLLRAGERVFKTDMSYLARGGAWTTVRFGITTVASVITVIAFGNLLPRDVYGSYNYVLSLAGSLTFLTLSGMSTSLIRAVARGKENLLYYSMAMQVRYNLLSVAAVALAALYYMLKGNATFALSLAMLAVALPLSSAYHLYESVLIGKKRFDTLAIMTGLTSLFGAGLTVLTLLLTHSVLILVAVYSIVSLVPNIFAYEYVKNRTSTGPTDEESVKELRRTAFHLTGAGFVSILTQYLDKIVLFQVSGPAALAVYGFAIAGPERLKGLVKNWVSIALPNLSTRSLSEIRHVFYRRVGFALLIGASLALAYIVAAPVLFKFLLPKYLDSIKYSQTYALGIIVVPVSIFVGNVFNAQNMLRAVYTNNIGSQALRLLLFLFLGWRWQTWGLIIASIVTYAASALYVIVVWEFESRRLMNKT